jgi:hypothetical protein
MAGCEGYERDCPSLICSLDPGFTDMWPFVSVVSGRAGDPGREVCMRSHNIFFYTLFLPLIIFNTCTIIIFFYYLRDMSDLNEREFPLPAESLGRFPALPHMGFGYGRPYICIITGLSMRYFLQIMQRVFDIYVKNGS